MTKEEFDRLWNSGQRDKLWNRDLAIEELKRMATFPHGNKFTRAAARRQLRAVLAAPVQTR